MQDIIRHADVCLSRMWEHLRPDICLAVSSRIIVKLMGSFQHILGSIQVDIESCIRSLVPGEDMDTKDCMETKIPWSCRSAAHVTNWLAAGLAQPGP